MSVYPIFIVLGQTIDSIWPLVVFNCQLSGAGFNGPAWGVFNGVEFKSCEPGVESNFRKTGAAFN